MREVIEKQDCEFISTCPFFNDEKHSEMTESLKEEFCHGNYTWCGRYPAYQALKKNEIEIEIKTTQTNQVLLYKKQT